MNDSKRLVIQKRLCALMESEIKVANGYNFDLVKAWRGRNLFTAQDALPCVSLLETLVPDRVGIRSEGQPIQIEQWVLQVQGWVADDYENPTDPAHVLMADVKKALAQISNPMKCNSPNYNLGGSIIKITFEPGTVRPPDEVSSIAYFFLRVIIHMVEDAIDPFKL